MTGLKISSDLYPWGRAQVGVCAPGFKGGAGGGGRGVVSMLDRLVARTRQIVLVASWRAHYLPLR